MSTSTKDFQGNQRLRIAGICIFLAAITFVVFGQTLRRDFDFINYDDNLYVYSNPLVTPGLTYPGVIHALAHSTNRFYTPLTMISLMADAQIHGVSPRGYHLTNLLLHSATAVLLFLVLLQMTGATWRCAFVAAVFAIHPLHVESVAWVSERKDVLSGLFFVLTLWAYFRYVQHPRSWLRYFIVAVVYALGLLCKSTLVTLPFLLLLLDYWPLNRFPIRTTRLVIEKIPLLILSAASCVVTFRAQHDAIEPVEMMSHFNRIANALVSYVIYIGQMFYPAGLAVFYPRAENSVPVLQVVLATALLALVSTAAIVLRKKHPWLIVGWLWYLGMLVPMNGLFVQVGMQAHADRYTYLSQIGLYLMLAWGGADLCDRLRIPPVAARGAALLVTGILIVCSVVQVSYWKNSETVFRHALDCTSRNFLACNNLGSALFAKGRVDDAIAIYEEGLEYRPSSGPLNDNLGMALFQKGRIDEAIVHYQLAVASEPGSAMVHYNLGNALLLKSDYGDAVFEWQRTLEIDPRHVEAMASIAWVLATSADDALRNGSKAVELAQRADQISGGRNPIVLRTLAAAYAEAGRFPEAVDATQRALQIIAGQGNISLEQTFHREGALYEAGKPLRAGSR